MIDVADPIPSDIEALLRAERAIPDVAPDVARALWTKVARSIAVTGGLGGASLLLIGGFVASVLGGGAWLLGHRAVRVATSAQPEAAATSEKEPGPGRSSPQSSESLGRSLPQSSPIPSEGAIWPSWFGQRDAPWRRIAGRVMMDGRPVEGAELMLTSVAAAPDEHVRTAADGSFSFPPHPAWGYGIGGAFRGATTTEHLDLRDPTQDTEHLELVLAACASRIESRVLDERGGPVSDAHVQLVEKWIATPDVSVAADGRFTLCLPAKGGWLVVGAPGYGLQTVGRAEASSDIVLHAEAVLSGTTTDLEGRALPDAQVNLWPTDVELGGNAHRSARSDADGHYRIDGIQPGEYYVNAWTRDHTTTVAQPKLHAASGTTSTQNIALERVYEVKGVLTQNGMPVAGQLIAASFAKDQLSMMAVTQADGSFSCGNVPAGVVGFEAPGKEVASPAVLDVQEDVTGVRVELAP